MKNVEKSIIKVGDICYDISDGQVKILCKEKKF